MRLLVLTRFDRLGASSRLRMLQYFPWFEQAGINVEHHGLLGNEYIQRMYGGGRRISLAICKSYVRRAIDLFRSRKFDVVLLEKEGLPWLPAWIELSLISKRTRLIVDLDDAQFHRYDRHSNWLVRRFLGRKIDRVIRRSDIATVGTGYLEERALAAQCRRVEVVPTVVNLDRYQSATGAGEARERVTIGWIGSPATAFFLAEITEPLRQLSARYSIRCIAIGARTDQVSGTPFVAVPWSEESEVESLMSLDIGIMPISDGPWERGKCGYKLIQYMACGIPVVASAVGANMEIVREGENGLLVRSNDEWCAALERLISNRDIRIAMGRAGRRRVAEWFSLQVQGPRMTEIICSAAPGAN